MSITAELTASTKDTDEVKPANTKHVKNNTPSIVPHTPINPNTLGKTINANPIPPETTSSNGNDWLEAINPNIANTPIAHKNSNPQFANAVINALLFISLFFGR